MTRENIDNLNTDPQYWEKILTDNGMPAELPDTRTEISKRHNFAKIVDFREEFDNVRAMQDLTDDQIVEENIFGEPTMAKDGLPPCLRLKRYGEEEKGSD